MIYEELTNMGTWSEGRKMPEALSRFGCVTVGSNIYCIGGLGVNLYTDKVRIYDTITDTWTTGEPMLSAKAGFGCVLVGNKIYCIGGLDATHTTSNPLNESCVYNVDTAEWSTIAALPIGLAYLYCHELAGKIYCFGGYDSSFGGPSLKLFIYDINSDTWFTGADSPGGKYLTPGSCIHNMRLYSLTYSAIYSSPTTDQMIYHIEQDRWNWGKEASKQFLSTSSDLGFITNDQYAFVGYDESLEPYQFILIYNFSNETYYKIVDAPVDFYKTNLGSTMVGNKCYLFGGDGVSGNQNIYYDDVKIFTFNTPAPPATHTVTVQYRLEDGTELKPGRTQTAQDGEGLTLEAPAIVDYAYLGYQVDGGALSAQETVTLTVTGDLTVTFVYGQAQSACCCPPPYINIPVSPCYGELIDQIKEYLEEHKDGCGCL